MNTDGHSKTDGDLDRGHLKGSDGDAANVSSAPSATTFATRLAEDAIAPNPDRPGACLPSKAPSNRLLNGQLAAVDRKLCPATPSC